MQACIETLNLNVTVLDAVDGRFEILRIINNYNKFVYRKLNDTYLDKLGIHFMPGWKDPWGER